MKLKVGDKLLCKKKIKNTTIYKIKEKVIIIL